MIEQIKEALEKAQRKNTELERDIDEIRDERDDLHARLMAVESECHQLRTENTAMKEQLECVLNEEKYEQMIRIASGYSGEALEKIGKRGMDINPLQAEHAAMKSALEILKDSIGVQKMDDARMWSIYTKICSTLEKLDSNEVS